MRRLARLLGVLAALVLLPSAVFAQAVITGTVKDSSGGVLPGVTVEAASPALIEKVRTAVSDGNGRYQITNLRPGAYTVTFTLAGFNTFKRDGVTLAGSGAVQVDAELRVGALEETITVTGEAPVVDVQTITKQQVLNSDLVDSLPSARNYFTLARMIPGTQGGGNDVGGSLIQDVGQSVTVHGSKNADQRVTANGLNTMTLQAGGNIGGQTPDVGSAAEVTVDTTSLSADLPTGGVRINFVPRDGGNTFTDSTFFTFSNEALQGDNFTDELRTAGLPTPNKVIKNWDLNEAFGGPFKKDKVWFWFSTRYNEVENEVPVFTNLNAFKPTEWLYVPDTSAPGRNKGNQWNNRLRVTWQATPRNKFAGTYGADKWCNCPNNISATVSPEAGRDRRFPRLRQEHAEWTSPVTNKLLLEAVGLHLFERWGNMHLRLNGGSLADAAQEAVLPQMISVNDQRTGLTYRQQGTFNNTEVPNWTYRASAAYVTGSHALKVGFNNTSGFLREHNYPMNPLAYRVNSVDANGDGIWESVTPNQFTMNTVWDSKSTEDMDLGLYVQDKWSISRATINLALRYDHLKTSSPAQTIGPDTFAPTRNITFPETDILNWSDITYRTGLAYDLRGDGKTAIKIAFNKYLLGQTLNGLGQAQNPVRALTKSTNRAWADNDHDFVVDCDLLTNTAQSPANGFVDTCGTFSNSTFNSLVPGATYDPDLLTGWGHRPTNWETSASIQHELMRGIGIDVGYFRRVWKNFEVTDNLAVEASDFTRFDVTVPTDSRLPNGGGYTVHGIYNVVPAKFGETQEFHTLDSSIGAHQVENWNGFDITVNARLQNGLMVQAGTSTGATTTDNCEVVAALPEMAASGTITPPEFCHQAEPMRTQFKMFGVYTLPKIDLQVSGTFRSTPQDDFNANFRTTNAYLASNSTLGRPLAGAANSTLTIALVEPQTVFLVRRNELDLRFGKVLRFGRSRSVLSFDLFNALNADTVLGVNQTFSDVWQTPTSVLNARLAKISWQFDF